MNLRLNVSTKQYTHSYRSVSEKGVFWSSTHSNHRRYLPLSHVQFALSQYTCVVVLFVHLLSPSGPGP